MAHQRQDQRELGLLHCQIPAREVEDAPKSDTQIQPTVTSDRERDRHRLAFVVQRCHDDSFTDDLGSNRRVISDRVVKEFGDLGSERLSRVE